MKFKYVLFNEKIIRHKMKRIQSKKHELGTLSCFDDKRYVLDDGIPTLAYSHKDSVAICKKNKKIVIIKKNCND